MGAPHVINPRDGRKVIDFAGARKWAESLDDDAIAYTVEDARQARDAADDLERHGYIANSGFYADEIHVLLEERNRRAMRRKKEAGDAGQ